MVRSHTPTCPKANRREKRIEKGKLVIEELESGVKSLIKKFKQPKLWVLYNWVSLKLLLLIIDAGLSVKNVNNDLVNEIGMVFFF